MKKLKFLLYFIGVGQIVLGIMALFFPAFFVETVMYLSEINPDTGYPLGMFAGRLLVFGIGMFITARDPQKYLILIKGMILIQIIDLLVGLFYVSIGLVDIYAAALPLFNATIFIILLQLWKPKCLKK